MESAKMRSADELRVVEPLRRRAASSAGTCVRGCAIIRDLIDCRHDGRGRRLMHHLTGARNAVKPALRNVGVEPGGLRIDIDQPILLAGDDDDGHLQTRHDGRYNTFQIEKVGPVPYK
jgi:hypothetical protein